MIKSICVYCGSNPGKSPAYREGAVNLAEALARENIGLVYGGGSVGLMGIMADTLLERGGRVTGVIPEDLVRREVGHGGLTEQIVVDSMHERKAAMAERSDGFIAMPGGLGTLEELFEVLTWAQLGIHRKPVAILNVGGYYDRLVSFLDHGVEEGFVKAPHRNMLMVENNPDSLLERFASYQPPAVRKWMSADQT
ncbi:MAG: TIGR00730 family Rossman fold protein [Balneolaceae bacterium]|nr:TIGR00730 family Rossman fold protein [Balneolaceae bacterium]